ncbi:hypothetical protein A3E33_03020 [Candidatus Nomurabacteria bacterium RIFCSPHIGHO2_12_FULL_40_77]|nr:MAG: hypothetical protein A3E33_03020 [Candidatus Nomurabacteria bacterium RIFCSPHIGHO2_12_FULL_40_77]HBG68723.1 hypothetical protein [Candidatus Nomurabacteria bacterium]
MKKFLMAVAIIVVMTTMAHGQQVVLAPGRVPGVEGYLPVVVAGDGNQTTLLVRGPAGTAKKVGFDLFDQDGQASQLLVNGEPAVLFVAVTNPMTGKVVTELTWSGQFKVVWVKVTQPLNINGVPETSVSMALQKVIGAGVVPFAADLAPVEATKVATFYGGKRTGLAFCNPNDTTVTISITREGAEVVTKNLAPKAQVSLFLGELFSKFSSGVEFIRIDSSLPVAVMPLVTDGENFFTLSVDRVRGN